MCSIIGVGERLHKVLGQIDLGTLDSGERSLPFGLLVSIEIFSLLRSKPMKLTIKHHRGRKSFRRNSLHIADALNVLANQIVLFFNTRRHKGKSSKIRKQDNSAHFSEDFPYSVSVTALQQFNTWGNQINGYFNQQQNCMRISLIPSMLPFR